MTWTPKRAGALPWRDYLTKEERSELNAIERNAAKIDGERRQLTVRRNLIMNRAMQRARYAELEKRHKD